MKCNLCGNALSIIRYGGVIAYFCKCGHRSVSSSNHDSGRKQIGHISIMVLEEMGFGIDVNKYNRLLKENERRKLHKIQESQ